MARQYSAKTFLRSVPNTMLEEYFKRRGVDLGFRWDMLRETEVNPIFEAMERLDEQVRSRIDSDFSMINDLACEGGTQAILEDAELWNHDDWPERFSRMNNAYERAMWTFLNDPKRFQVAGCFHEMDRLGGWRRRFVGKFLQARCDEQSLAAFQKSLRIFYRRQGRGRHCHVDVYERHDPERQCYFAYPEDYASTDIGYDERGRFQHRARRSAFEIIFVYRPEDGLLELRARGNKRQITQLEEIFCKTILGLVQLPEDGRVPFDLAVLKDSAFSFRTAPKDRVAAVHVRAMRFDVPASPSWRIAISANANDRRPRALHELLDQAIDQSKLPISDLHVSQAKLRFTFEPHNGERPKSLTFEVTYPDRCTLRDDTHDQIAKKYLKEWGIARD
ncbi:MAG: hypothetical protein HRU71_13060 [Planctomycetia bacterium]|nr:MAG: hypothetical protein HRU71_13060 [Planctomycetia bacterium]